MALSGEENFRVRFSWAKIRDLHLDWMYRSEPRVEAVALKPPGLGSLRREIKPSAMRPHWRTGSQAKAGAWIQDPGVQSGNTCMVIFVQCFGATPENRGIQKNGNSVFSVEN